MAVMRSVASYGLVCVVVLCVTLLPSVWAAHCSSYWDEDGNYHDAQQCGSLYCCGGCNAKYCCTAEEYQQTPSKPESCLARSASKTQHFKTAVIVAAVLGTLLPVIVCVAIIICCLCPFCLIYKKCRKGRNQRQQIVINTASATSVPEHHPPAQPSYPGYQPVPVVHGYGGPPVPTAPHHPPYLQAGGPAHAPDSFPLGQPVHPPTQPPAQYDQPPPYSDEHKQPPFNPSYGPNP